MHEVQISVGMWFSDIIGWGPNKRIPSLKYMLVFVVLFWYWVVFCVDQLFSLFSLTFHPRRNMNCKDHITDYYNYIHPIPRGKPHYIWAICVYNLGICKLGCRGWVAHPLPSSVLCYTNYCPMHQFSHISLLCECVSAYLPLWLSVCLSVCMSVCLSVCQFCLYVCQPGCQPVWLPVYQSVCLSVCQSPSVHLCTFTFLRYTSNNLWRCKQLDGGGPCGGEVKYNVQFILQQQWRSSSLYYTVTFWSIFKFIHSS